MDFFKTAKEAVEAEALLEALPTAKSKRRTWIDGKILYCAGANVTIFILLLAVLLLVNKDCCAPAGNRKWAEKEVLTSGRHHETGLTVQYDDLGAFIQCDDSHVLSSAESKASICKFDLMLNGWLPSPCFNAAMHHDYVDGHDFGFFQHRNATVPVPQSIVMLGDTNMFPKGLWVSKEQHYGHCSYLLNSSISALPNPRAGLVDTYLNAQHMEHCLGVVTAPPPTDMNAITPHTKIFFDYRKCYLGIEQA